MSGPPPSELALWLRQVIQGPIEVDRSLLEFLAATCGTCDPAAVLADPEGSEAASFIELLVSPAPSVQLDFETCWGDRPYPPAQVAALAEALDRPPVTAVLRMDKGRRLLPVTVPGFAIRGFIERLNITWLPPAALIDLVRSALAPGLQAAVRARLRHSRIEWNRPRIDLLEQFLTRLPAASADFDGLLGFLLQILDELAPGRRPFEFLIEKKLFFFQALCRQEALEERRLGTAMELLMLQGVRLAPADAGHCRAAMQMLDRLCTALYGQTRFFHRPIGPPPALEG